METQESWSAKGNVDQLRAAYAGFHMDVRTVLAAAPACHKRAILERAPLPRWSEGRVVLLGDACHPMTPCMAQGAATSIEDAAILARCLEAVNGEDLEDAFRTYEAHRKPRVSPMQAISSHLQRQHLDEGRRDRQGSGHQLALRLRRLECAAHTHRIRAAARAKSRVTPPRPVQPGLTSTRVGRVLGPPAQPRHDSIHRP